MFGAEEALLALKLGSKALRAFRFGGPKHPLRRGTPLHEPPEYDLLLIAVVRVKQHVTFLNNPLMTTPTIGAKHSPVCALIALNLLFFLNYDHSAIHG
jgi:hypothetical protein